MVVYQHYEKPMANKKVVHEQSAISTSCKQAVHTNEVVRRILNTSPRLEWSSFVAPVITDYMARMSKAGYDEIHRKIILLKSLKIYDRIVREEQDKVRPINRPKDWQREQRSKAKRDKKHNWATRGGCVAPIIIPPTPHSELLKMLREVAEAEAMPGLKFKIVEGGGKPVRRVVQRSNPTASDRCETRDCLACKGGTVSGSRCRKSNVVYEVGCQLCPEDKRATYIGETARNLYTRGREHMQNFDKKKTESFIFKHQQDQHYGTTPDFKASVKYSFKDSFLRQIAEGVAIRRCEGIVLNTKAEWHQPAIWRVRSELSQE